MMREGINPAEVCGTNQRDYVDLPLSVIARVEQSQGTH